MDLMVIGDVSFAEVVSALDSAQETLGREVNPTVYPPDEIKSKLAKGHYFLENVLGGPKYYLIGNDNELNRLVEKRLAG